MSNVVPKFNPWHCMRGRGKGDGTNASAVELFNSTDDAALILVWRIFAASSGNKLVLYPEYGHSLSGSNEVGQSPLVTGEAVQAGQIYTGSYTPTPNGDYLFVTDFNTQNSDGAHVPLAVLRPGWSLAVLDAFATTTPVDAAFIWQVCRKQDFDYLDC